MFSDKIMVLYNAVVKVAEIVQKELRCGVLATVKDGVRGGSHHSIGTQADAMSQEYLLGQLRAHCPDVRFLAEENCRGPDIITDASLGFVKGGMSLFWMLWMARMTLTGIVVTGAFAATLIPLAGGKVIWYHYRSGQLVQLTEPDLSAYGRINRKDNGGLGFIADYPDLVDWL